MLNELVSTASPGSLDAKRIRRIAGRAMNLMERKPVWANPTEKLAIYAAVSERIDSMVRAGDLDDPDILQRALELIHAERSEAVRTNSLNQAPRALG